MATGNQNVGILRGASTPATSEIRVTAHASQEVTTFNAGQVNAAFQQWAAMEIQRVNARKAYDDAVISGLQLTFSAQIAFNAINAQATKARTDYYAIVAAMKKQLRNREIT